jgi:hypothetical protein
MDYNGWMNEGIDGWIDRNGWIYLSNTTFICIYRHVYIYIYIYIKFTVDPPPPCEPS